MPKPFKEIKDVLAEIDGRVEPVAISSPEGSSLETLAYAIHNLVGCVEDLADYVATIKRP